MSALILELKQGESMILNGAVIRFKTRTRLELNTQARFLFGKQIMHQEEATSPARKAYYVLQQAYIGTEPERPEALVVAKALIAELRDEAEPGIRPVWEALLSASASEAGFEALKLARQMIRAEDAVVLNG
ncbi:flagellar biosynthesis repressor FlbT [Acidocella sp.]|uniref:flagellar biosynthesis repressor FlbT n=1 Tax=Acidocella sp. TaxID=50710 RepID=UPI00260A17D9|nr:flagellar biosynthesis repressor FlbT [Acidocella sp.]